MVAEKKFRSDLTIVERVSDDCPAATRRREDIPLLVRYFSNKYAGMEDNREHPREAMTRFSVTRGRAISGIAKP